MDDTASTDNMCNVGYLECHRYILLNQKKSITPSFQAKHNFCHILYQDRSQSFRRLVHKEKIRVRHQSPRNSKHLLFSS